MLKNCFTTLALSSIILFFTQNHFILGSVWLFTQAILGVLLLLGMIYLRKNNKLRLLLLFAFLMVLLDKGYHHFMAAPSYQFNQIQQITPTPLRVLTFNLYFKNKRPETNIQAILTQDADLVFCQEITPQWVQLLNTSLTSKYPFHKVIALKGTHGIGVYSKFPLVNDYQLNNSHNLPYAHLVTVNHPSGIIHTANLHLASPAIAFENPQNFVRLYASNAASRQKQWHTLKTSLEKHPKNEALLVVGDLNTLDYEPLYRNIRKDFVDAYRVAGAWPGYNFPNTQKLPFKIARLDYLLLQGKVQTTQAKVLPQSSSDHFAIVVDLLF
jgi:endonuclease/exonuclease/phosphatase (EEP) superfamily protein YafD